MCRETVGKIYFMKSKNDPERFKGLSCLLFSLTNTMSEKERKSEELEIR